MAKVLLIAASPDEREMYAQSLRQAGHECVECRGCAEALAHAPGADALVTAVPVSGPMDGIDLVARLRVDSSTAHLPVIVLAGWQGDRQRAFAAGCDRFFLTPCLPRTLTREVARLVARRHR